MNAPKRIPPTMLRLMPRELLMLTGTDYGGGVRPYGMADVMLNTVRSAIQDLDVLCHAAADEAVDGEDLGMMLLRIRNRLDATADLFHRALRVHGTKACEPLYIEGVIADEQQPAEGSAES